MAPHTPSEGPLEPKAVVEGQLRECYGRVVYTHKTQEKCADLLLSRLNRIKVTQIVLSAITTAGFVGATVKAQPIAALVGVVVSTALLALNAYTKNYDLGELAQKHRQAAADLWLIRERYLALITDMRVGKESLERLTARRDALLDALHAVYAGAPSTNYAAHQNAQIALKQQADMTFSDAEIDAFLPKELRRGT